MADEPVEDRFRSALQDVVVIVRKLAPLCKDIEELVGLAQSALENDGVLHLLLREVTPLQMKK